MARRWARRTSNEKLLMENSESRRRGKLQTSRDKRGAFEGIILQVELAIEIEIVDARAQRGRGGVAERRVPVAADQNFQAMRTRGGDHPPCLVETAAFHQLDIYSIDLSCKRRDVSARET